jgi:hypothetical protein
LLEDLQTVDSWHQHVQYDQFEIPLVQQIKRFLSTCGGSDLVTLPGQSATQ